MMEATGHFATEHGQKYLAQLCKHFSHKIEVEYSERHGECRFEIGTAVLDAEPGALAIKVAAEDAERLHQVKAVVEDHLVRFAFREPGRSVNWSA
ncbi:hypothetical protein SAMN04488498_10884 [Mesorhizobium albiziae]|uniref:2,4-dihydroxyhept-2-ene-1,7-dioic acid aldolase n=1 Tax=Neomesorhizobium albiziae TaxID=335020 RepID=A0A1I4AHK9_9HYPH|nr:DUF2218 domain-containing protein [Mesorhizobium albiziae]GLS32880.1 hypothetical protein GCM10007937_45900 [Mesorhizobium albiziae]SFK55965.1 hypothetical protein SAMN04488498_10884 [Mesorhizobium albiziae]